MTFTGDFHPQSSQSHSVTDDDDDMTQATHDHECSSVELEKGGPSCAIQIVEPYLGSESEAS